MCTLYRYINNSNVGSARALCDVLWMDNHNTTHRSIFIFIGVFAQLKNSPLQNKLIIIYGIFVYLCVRMYSMCVHVLMSFLSVHCVCTCAWWWSYMRLSSVCVFVGARNTIYTCTHIHTHTHHIHCHDNWCGVRAPTNTHTQMITSYNLIITRTCTHIHTITRTHSHITHT